MLANISYAFVPAGKNTLVFMGYIDLTPGKKEPDNMKNPANDNWFTEEEEFQREIFQATREQIYREAEKKWGLSWAS